MTHYTLIVPDKMVIKDGIAYQIPSDDTVIMIFLTFMQSKLVIALEK